jgi:hypothetical protein
MIHTKLLTGSLNADLDLSPAKSRKAFAGRIEEIANTSAIGLGEELVNKMVNNKAPMRIRNGIRKKEALRKEARVEEVWISFSLSSYHAFLRSYL